MGTRRRAAAATAGLLLATGHPTAADPPGPGPASAAPASVADLRAPLVAAHRGGFFGGQGSLSHIAGTLSDGDADILEIDLRATRDGRVVVFHDGDLRRRTPCRGSVESRTHAELTACTLADGTPPPLFADVLAAAGSRAIIDAEFKTPAAIEPALDLVEAAGAIDRIYFQLGSNRDRYAQVRAHSPRASLQFKVLSDDDLDWALSRDDPNLRIIEMDRDFLDAARIARVHAAGKLVSANSWRYQYTEERFTASCGRAFRKGVDIAVTNNPRSCARQRHAPPGSALEEWMFRHAGRPRVRRLGRELLADLRDTQRRWRDRASAGGAAPRP